MFSIFKTRNTITNVEWLGVDMHSHLALGPDDGLLELEISSALIKSLGND